ncbi:MAG: GIY-YIG nuclease family protein [Subdoligranulum sp.]
MPARPGFRLGLHGAVCADGDLYSGWTNDLARRLRAHKGGKAGAKYTHAKGAVKLTYAERRTDKSAALKREAALKKSAKTRKGSPCRPVDR